VRSYGIEFLDSEMQNFWGISFPTS